MENVIGAPMMRGCTIRLCGLMFGLTLFRHRLFESSHWLPQSEHPSHKGHKIGVGGFVCIAGYGDSSGWKKKKVPADYRNKRSWERAIGIDWMIKMELAQAIPPAYTEYLGKQMIRILE
jgi:DNA (cytosine-5)-methyltransferase 1